MQKNLRENDVFVAVKRKKEIMYQQQEDLAKQHNCKDQKKVRRISDEWTIENAKEIGSGNNQF